jgi:hypothetical protein
MKWLLKSEEGAVTKHRRIPPRKKGTVAMSLRTQVESMLRAARRRRYLLIPQGKGRAVVSHATSRWRQECAAKGCPALRVFSPDRSQPLYVVSCTFDGLNLDGSQQGDWERRLRGIFSGRQVRIFQRQLILQVSADQLDDALRLLNDGVLDGTLA